MNAVLPIDCVYVVIIFSFHQPVAFMFAVALLPDHLIADTCESLVCVRNLYDEGHLLVAKTLLRCGCPYRLWLLLGVAWEGLLEVLS